MLQQKLYHFKYRNYSSQ